MARRKRNARATTTGPPAVDHPVPAGRTLSLSRRKVWFYRALLAIGGPLICLIVCEAVLRVGGYGYDTSFLVTRNLRANEVLTPNSKFSWRFFGSSFARQPAAFAIPRDKPENTVRVFLFGESAAFGDPQPDFGLPRMLQAMLSLRYPDTRFEVVNAAMTGINSHVIVPIARDCARAHGDIWVIYMGNNEVVGPFGAGTVFGPQAPSNVVIRGSLAIKTTRIGQMLSALQQAVQKPPASKSEWGGMLMFLENQVQPDDPRLLSVYRHFERNLTEILDIAHDAGVGVVVSTVAVNLKDCAPFTSLHRTGLSESSLASWQKHFRAGTDAQAAGDHEAAIR
jgi:hypothetical protein